MLPLFLLFVILPIAEIMLIINVSDSIGGWNTFFIVVTTAFFGAYFVRQQGFALIAQIQSKLGTGTAPSTEMAQGLLLLIAGVLLITPGFITDIIGFLFTLPFSRQPIAAFLMTKITLKQAGGFQQNTFHSSDNFADQFEQNSQHRPHNDGANADIIDGEYTDKTENEDTKDGKNRLN
jgi:UPF0716 protein FxsA